MITNIKEKIKKIKSNNDWFIVLAIFLTGLISFGLGRLSALTERKNPITIEHMPITMSSATSDVVSEKLYVASKSGTKYHYPWCSGAQNIKEENKIWFSTKEKAEAAGYAPASNCKGL